MESVNELFKICVFSSTKNLALDSMQKEIFMEFFSFFQEYS